MPVFRSDEEIWAYFTPKMENALEKAAQELENTYKQNVNTEVYGAGTPAIYPRQNDLLDAYKYETSGGGGEAILLFELDPDRVVGFPYLSPDPVSGEELVSIIFEGRSGPLYGHGFWCDARDPWTPLEAQAESIINKYAKEAFD